MPLKLWPGRVVMLPGFGFADVVAVLGPYVTIRSFLGGTEIRRTVLASKLRHPQWNGGFCP